jgi:hypothetical protein
VTKRYSILLASIVAVALVAPAYAQAIPEDVAKASADLAARQAEAVARAQQKVAQEAAAKANAVTPLDLEVVISRFQGDKKVGSLPYSLSVNASERGELTRLRMGASVPVPVMGPATQDGKSTVPAGPIPFNYKDIGTNVDASGKPLGDGRFTIFLSVSESSLVTSSQDSQQGGVPVIRTFSSANNLVMRDGQTRQFTAAADRVTGEVVKVEVTLKVAK